MSYPPTDDTKSKPLTAGEKTNWNKFLDFVEINNMKNNPILDQRNKQIGLSLLQKFNYQNPKYALPTDIVPKVQSEIQDYRNNLVGQWKAGKMQADVKNESEIMPNISPIDGWPGTKTLSTKFPIAKTETKDYGVATDQYDKDRGIVSTK